MAAEQCIFGICFYQLNGDEPKFFGFSEFLASLALMVLAWTIADVRYRFRLQSAPIPLQSATFSVVTAIGILTLLTDLWRAEQWYVPVGHLLTPSIWQALLGSIFLLTFLTWAWFAFIRPPIYGSNNAKRFAKALYRYILKGSPTELSVVADELTYSAAALVKHATDRGMHKRYWNETDGKKRRPPPDVEGYANDILLLIADKRMCRAIVESSPGTALAIYRAMAETEKYGVQVETFSKNIVDEAIKNKDSFIYHEAEGYESGLIGYHKPLSQAMFSNYYMVESIDTILDPDYRICREWDAEQWEAYCRAVLMTFQSCVEIGYVVHSNVLDRAMQIIQNAVSDLYTLNNLDGSHDTDSSRRLSVVVDFIKDAVKILDKNGVPNGARTRVKEKHGHPRETLYDHIASMIFEVIFHASEVKTPWWTCWTTQRNSVWSKLFNYGHLGGPAGKLVKFKVRRLLYDEIVDMNDFPNFKGAKILGFCLNVMGLTICKDNYGRDSRPLHKAVLAWTKTNFVWLHEYNSEVADACLVEGMSYDADNQRLVRTSPAGGLRREPSYIYFDLDPAPPEPEPAPAQG